MILLWQFSTFRLALADEANPPTCLPMKPARLVLTPTRSRRLNELIGLLVLASAVLLFLSLASYHPTDPSLNTVGSGSVHNWIGPAGAYLSDVMLQIEGISAFILPILLAALGWTWMLSRPAGSPGSKAIGIVLILLFSPRSSPSSPAIPPSSTVCPLRASSAASSPTSSFAFSTIPAHGSSPLLWSPLPSTSPPLSASIPPANGWASSSPSSSPGAIASQTGAAAAPRSAS